LFFHGLLGRKSRLNCFALLLLCLIAAAAAAAPSELNQASQQKNQRDGNVMEIAKAMAMRCHSSLARQSVSDINININRYA
jgi:hypothetical protein